MSSGVGAGEDERVVASRQSHKRPKSNADMINNASNPPIPA